MMPVAERDVFRYVETPSTGPEDLSCGSDYRHPALVWCIALGLWLAAPLVAATPETYRFDPVHTQIWFSADHLGFSHPLGRLRVADGWFVFDPDDWAKSRVDVTIDIASAEMGDADWTKAVQSQQFLNAGKWPTAHFSSIRVEKTGATTGIIHGVLELHGSHLPLDVAFTFNRSGSDPYTFQRKIGFSARATLQRSEYGLNRYQEVVGNTINLRFEIEGIRDRGAATRNEHAGDDTSEDMQ